MPLKVHCDWSVVFRVILGLCNCLSGPVLQAFTSCILETGSTNNDSFKRNLKYIIAFCMKRLVVYMILGVLIRFLFFFFFKLCIYFGLLQVGRYTEKGLHREELFGLVESFCPT